MRLVRATVLSAAAGAGLWLLLTAGPAFADPVLPPEAGAVVSHTADVQLDDEGGDAELDSKPVKMPKAPKPPKKPKVAKAPKVASAKPTMHAAQHEGNEQDRDDSPREETTTGTAVTPSTAGPSGAASRTVAASLAHAHHDPPNRAAHTPRRTAKAVPLHPTPPPPLPGPWLVRLAATAAPGGGDLAPPGVAGPAAASPMVAPPARGRTTMPANQWASGRPVQRAPPPP